VRHDVPGTNVCAASLDRSLIRVAHRLIIGRRGMSGAIGWLGRKVLEESLRRRNIILGDAISSWCRGSRLIFFSIQRTAAWRKEMEKR
jgi:hypothetical protein